MKNVKANFNAERYEGVQIEEANIGNYFLLESELGRKWGQCMKMRSMYENEVNVWKWGQCMKMRSMYEN